MFSFRIVSIRTIFASSRFDRIKTKLFESCKNVLFALILTAISFLIFAAPLTAVEVPLDRNKLTGSGTTIPEKYVPPMISNGSISFEIDWTGGQGQRTYTGVWRAGRRYSMPDAKLIPYGWFEQRISVDGKQIDGFEQWAQTLDVHNGQIINLGRSGGIEQIMTVFVPFEKDLIGFQRKISNNSDKTKKVKLAFLWHLCPPLSKKEYPDRMIGNWIIQPETGTAFFDYTVYAHQISRGRLAVFSDSDNLCSVNDKTAILSKEISLKPGETKKITFYVLTADTLDGSKFSELVSQGIAQTLADGSDSLLDKHKKNWNDFYAQSSVDLPEEDIQRIYNTGQYHLRINATKWSFPVGIAPRLWNGRYFGWDEMFCHQGLLTSNHVEIARRCPEFRKAGLKTAVFRVAHYGRPGKYGARYVWETLEDGSEGAPSGFWFDHIFHMSNIARSAWSQYLYTDDLDYLKSTGYPVILECARYYRSHWVYEDSNGELYLGKCTDLERLGPAKDHPFMTTCGAIYTMRAAAEASALLKVNPDEAADFRKTADKLVQSLPQRNGAYIAYPNCQEHSIATLGGLFPYDIFDESNSLQKKAAYTFIRDGRANGNMYPVGNSVCPWFAGWMAAAMAFLEDKNEPVKLMRESAGTAGDFGELYEINEKKVSMKPWFSTAAGNIVYAINQMLVHAKDQEIRLAAGVPETWKNYSFRLPTAGGILVNMSVKNGKLASLDLKPVNKKSDRVRILTLPEHLLTGIELKPEFKRESKNGTVRLTVAVGDDIKIL